MLALLGLLSKIPGVSHVLDLAKTKTRLFVEYLLIGALAVMMGGFAHLWLTREKVAQDLRATKTELASVQGRLIVVENVNQEQEKTIGELKTLRQSDARALGGLLTDYRVLTNQDARARSRLDQLEKTNDTVRAFLDRRLPGELVSLLNCGATSRDQGIDKDRKGCPTFRSVASVSGTGATTN